MNSRSIVTASSPYAPCNATVHSLPFHCTTHALSPYTHCHAITVPLLVRAGVPVYNPWIVRLTCRRARVGAPRGPRGCQGCTEGCRDLGGAVGGRELVGGGGVQAVVLRPATTRGGGETGVRERGERARQGP